jgi:ABC-type methionine transport system ATPase subunit
LVGVWKAFDRGRDRVSVLADVSLEVASGQIAAVVRTRQGKTTLIRVASGMLPAEEIGCGVLMAVSDHSAAVRSGQVGQLTHDKLRTFRVFPTPTGCPAAAIRRGVLEPGSESP